MKIENIVGLILTFDEEINILNSIKSLNFCNEIIVFDSFSSDNTVNIATKHGAVVKKRKFDNYASQRNAALNSVPKKYDWVIMIDADEVVTNELTKEIIKVVKNSSNDESLFLVRRKDFFMGQWIKRSSGYPTWFPRLFKNGEVLVEREINEEYVTKGKKGMLKEHLLHYPFKKGIDWWFNRHNKYSSMEAVSLTNEFQNSIPWRYVFSNDATLKRKFQKQLFYRMPYRPVVMFVLLYIVRCGFLDGKAGYAFCKLRYIYESMISLKMQEIKFNINSKNES